MATTKQTFLPSGQGNEHSASVLPSGPKHGRVRRSRSTSGHQRQPFRARTWLASLLIVGSVIWLLVEGMGNSLVYFRTVNQAIAQRSQLGSSYFRLEGDVVPGSIRPLHGGVGFVVRASGKSVSVVNSGSPPQLFAAGMPVVLDGHFLQGSNEFYSTQILIKHTATYIAQHPGRVKGDPSS